MKRLKKGKDDFLVGKEILHKHQLIFDILSLLLFYLSPDTKTIVQTHTLLMRKGFLSV